MVNTYVLVNPHIEGDFKSKIKAIAKTNNETDITIAVWSDLNTANNGARRGLGVSSAIAGLWIQTQIIEVERMVFIILFIIVIHLNIQNLV